MTNYQFERETLGSLPCGIVRPQDDSQRIHCLAIFCHGFGAGGDDLVGLAPELLQRSGVDNETARGTALVFPEAPLDLAEQGMPGGRAWWLLSIQRLLSALEEGHYERVREEVPEGIDEARSALLESIELLLGRYDLDESRLILGGFSQGAMLATDTALRGLKHPPAGLVLYSGCLICERVWKPLAERLRSTQILQSHGSLDPILPLQTGKWLAGMLRDAGCEVDFTEFPGVHTIPSEALSKSAELLTRMMASQP